MNGSSLHEKFLFENKRNTILDLISTFRLTSFLPNFVANGIAGFSSLPRNCIHVIATQAARVEIKQLYRCDCHENHPVEIGLDGNQF